MTIERRREDAAFATRSMSGMRETVITREVADDGRESLRVEGYNGIDGYALNLRPVPAVIAHGAPFGADGKPASTDEGYVISATSDPETGP